MVYPDALPPTPAAQAEAAFLKRRLDDHQRALYWATAREIGYRAVRTIEAKRWIYALGEFSRYLNGRDDGVYL